MQKDKQFYDRFFTKYPVNVHDHAPRFRAVSELLRGSVLDVACGTGTLSKYYAGDYFGIDISDVAIKKAKAERRKDARFMQGDVCTMPTVSTMQYDSIYAGEFLEHIENDEVLFDRMLKKLKKGGRIVVSVPNGTRIPDESHCRIFTVASIRRDYSKYGKITFHTWEGFAGRILFSIEPDAPEPNNMTLVMICKDEEKGLETAIISALPIVDRVVVSVDTGTTDKTKEIAEMYADEVREHTWENNFSKARNEAQANVKSKWILFLDGHEYIESTGKFNEKTLLDVDGIFVTVRMENGMTFLYPRIYRSHLQFKNAVHNLVECKTKTADPAFVIVHDRINLQAEDAIERRNAQRAEMMPAELKKQLQNNPENSRAHFHLANFYLMEENMKLAMKHYKKTVKYSISHDEVYMSYISIGRIHLSLGHKIRALMAFNRADALIPDRWETNRIIGGFYLLEEHWQKAAEHFVQALGQNKRHYTYEPMKQDLREIWDLLGHCFNKLNHNEKAKIAWERALEHAQTDAQRAVLREKIKLISSILPKSNEPQVKIPVKDLNEAQ